jgi:hypothetical protein
MLKSLGWDRSILNASAESRNRVFEAARWALPIGWLAAAVGCYGPWIAHKTAALTLAGPDLGEFVKFLPGVIDGSLHVIRQLFYFPIAAVVLSVSLLVGSRCLRYPWPVRAAALLLSLSLSTQLLPPAWSLTSLRATEFRVQSIALLGCWLALAAFWLLGRLSLRWTSLAAAVLMIASALLSTWQYAVVKPAIDAVYGRPSGLGWGFALCLVGLLLGAAASMVLGLIGGGVRRP